MKYFSWNVEKNARLRKERNVSFEEVVYHILRGDLLATVEHQNQELYPGQRILIENIDDYAYLVPFVEAENEIFLKTIIPSRKATRKYLRQGAMSDQNLDRDEKEILESYERDEWVPVADQEAEAQRYLTYAEATFKKDKRINIRISRKDLEAIQKRALEEGIPYQTLVASILHKYVSGRLVERYL